MTRRTVPATALRRVLLTVLLAVLALLGATLTGSPAARAATAPTATAPTLPAPPDDPFYATVPNVGSLANGTVVRSRTVDASIAFLTFRVPTTSWQIAYKSLDANNAPIINVTTLVVPTKAWTGTTGRPVIGYQNAEDSTGWRCAASYSLRTGSNLLTGAEQSIMASALDRGFALAIADHEGPTSAFLAGPQSAHVVLDGLRAVLAFAPAGFNRSTPLGLWGYSGGGHATAWAGEQAGSYAPELKIVGSAFGGAPTTMANTVRKLDGGPFTAFVFMGVAGLLHAYPTWNLPTYLNAQGRQLLASAGDACIADVGVSLAFKKIADQTTVADVLKVPSVASLLTRIDLGKAAPKMPTYIYYSPIDEAVPEADTLALVKQYCAAGTPTVTDVQWVSEHVTLAVSGSGGALDFLGNRFAGKALARSATACR